MSNNATKAIHPTIVVRNATNVAQQMPISAGDQQELEKLCSFLLPPPDEKWIRCGLYWMDQMNIIQELIHSEKTHYLEKPTRRSISKPHGLGREYPVFYAVWKFSTANHANGIMVGKLCLIFLRKCHEVLGHSDKITPSTYYSHVLALRDTLLSLADGDVLSGSDSTMDKIVNFILRQFPEIANEACEQEKIATTKARVCLAILSGELKIGVPQKNRGHSSFQGKTRGRRITELVRSQESGMPDNISVTVSFSDDEDEEEPRDQQSGVAKTVQRESPRSGSRLSRSDDRRQLRTRLQSIAARNVRAITDPNCLHIPVLAWFLGQLIQTDRTLFCFCWLLVTTGISPDRLQDLVRKDTPNDTAEAWFDMRTNHLIYKVQNGATEFDPNNDRIYMRLALPGWLINEFGLEHPPFKNAIALANKQAKEFSLQHPGNTPSCERLAATFYRLFATEDHLTRLEAATIAGRIPASLRAQARYYALDRRLLNRQYQMAHAEFIKRITSIHACSDVLRQALSAFSFPAQLPSGLVGSQLAEPPNNSGPLIKALNQRFNTACSCLRSSFAGKDKWLVQALNLQHANLYLMLQVNLALRPIGDATSLSPSPAHNRAITQTKADAVFRNQSLAICPRSLHHQIEACKDALLLAQRWMEEHPDAIFPHHDPLPLYFSLKKGGGIHACRMSGSLFRQVLNDHGLNSLFHERNNAWRHIAASALHRQVPEIILDEMMSHDRDGLDFAGPWSTASLTSFSSLEDPLNELTKTVGIKVLRIKEIGHV